MSGMGKRKETLRLLGIYSQLFSAGGGKAGLRAEAGFKLHSRQTQVISDANRVLLRVLFLPSVSMGSLPWARTFARHHPQPAAFPLGLMVSHMELSQTGPY